MDIKSYVKVRVVKEYGILEHLKNKGGRIDSELDSFSEDLIPIFKIIYNKARYGFMNKKGEWCIYPKYEEVDIFKNGLAAVKLNGKWGYIDYEGNEVIPPIYDMAYAFSDDGFATVILNGNICTIDKTGKMYSVLNGELVHEYKNGYTIIKNGTNIEYYDEMGNLKISIEGKSAMPFSEGLSMVELEEGIKYIDETGTVVFSSDKYYWASSFKDGIAIAENMDNDIAYIMYPDFTIVPDENILDEITEEFDEGFVTFSYYENGKTKFAYMNNELESYLKFKIDGQYFDAEETLDFSEGLAAVKVDDKWGYIDKSMSFVIKPQFDGACSFRNGVALVSTMTKQGKDEFFINKLGEKLKIEITEEKYVGEKESVVDEHTTSVEVLEYKTVIRDDNSTEVHQIVGLGADSYDEYRKEVDAYLYTLYMNKISRMVDVNLKDTTKTMNGGN